MKQVSIPQHAGRRLHFPAIIHTGCLAAVPGGTSAFPRRGGRPAGREARALQPPGRRQPSRRPQGAGSGLRREGGVGHADHGGAGRPAAVRPDAAQALRLVPRVGGSRRTGLLPRPPLVRGDPAARADARGAGPLRVRRLGRRAGEAGAEAEAGGEAKAKARTPETRGRRGRRSRPGWSGGRRTG